MAIGIDLKGIGEIFSGAGKFAGDMRSAITGDISAEKKVELEIKMAEFEAAAINAQAEINKVEASSASLFVAGWRPALGWCGVIIIAVTYLINPILTAFGVPVAGVDMADLWPVITGMLGLVGARTYEKKTGTTGNH
jgi:hypothetical protein